MGLTLPCFACRRGLMPEQQNQQAACKQAGGKVALCGCLDVFCTVNVPADALGKEDDKTLKDAPSEKALTAKPTEPVDETTTKEVPVAGEAVGRSTMANYPAKMMLLCGALALSC